MRRKGGCSARPRDLALVSYVSACCFVGRNVLTITPTLYATGSAASCSPLSLRAVGIDRPSLFGPALIGPTWAGAMRERQFVERSEPDISAAGLVNTCQTFASPAMCAKTRMVKMICNDLHLQNDARWPACPRRCAR